MAQERNKLSNLETLGSVPSRRAKDLSGRGPVWGAVGIAPACK